MASYNEWKAHFDKKSIAQCKQQLKLIEMIDNKIDSKIKSEFQLNWLPGVGSAIRQSIKEREK